MSLMCIADPDTTTRKNPKLPEKWAYDYNHVGVLAELAKVKHEELFWGVGVQGRGEGVAKEDVGAAGELAEGGGCVVDAAEPADFSRR